MRNRLQRSQICHQYLELVTNIDVAKSCRIFNENLSGMKILIEYRDCDKNDEAAQISCLINLAQFFFRCNRFDLYRKIFKNIKNFEQIRNSDRNFDRNFA